MTETQTPPQDPRAEFINASVWHGSLERAQEILATHPEVASCDIHTAALLGDHEAVARFLAEDAANATAKGGPRDWDALTYLCFSKFLRLDPARSEGFLKAATALLNAAANPNTGFFEENHQPKPEWECALYAAAGVARHPELTKLLLDRGADPNDGEVAYHSPETLDNQTIHVLVESGKLTQDTIGLMLARKFNWHDDDGVHWLLEHGADPNWPLWGSRRCTGRSAKEHPSTTSSGFSIMARTRRCRIRTGLHRWQKLRVRVAGTFSNWSKNEALSSGLKAMIDFSLLARERM